MKRPLFIVALIYTGGILLAENVHVPLPWLFIASFAVACAALICKSARIYLLAPLLLLAGWSNQTSRTEVLSPNDLRLLIGNHPELVILHGKLRASPTERIFERDGEELWRTAAYVEVEKISRGTNQQPAFGTVMVTTPGILSSNFFAGQAVEITGVLQTPRGPLAKDLFDAQTFLRRKGIYFQLQTTSTNDWKLVGEVQNSLPLPDRFLAWSKKTLALGLPAEDAPLRLMWTLMLDWKAPLTGSVEEPFMRAGTFHIFAVDGLRIAIISAIFLGLFRALQFPRWLCGAFVIPIIWFYAGLTGWPASAIRAAIMMSIVIGGWALKRPSDLINSLFVAAFIILLWDPQQLFQAGFQLSFFVVLCIALLLPPTENFRKFLFKTDSFLPNELKPPWQIWLDRPLNFAFGIFATSLAAWLGSIPLAAYYFHLFTPVSTPANFFVVPLTMLALMSGLGSLLTAWWCPFLAVLFNYCSWFLMKTIVWFSEGTADWPAAYFYVSTPAPITFVWYYLALLTILTGWIFRSKFKRWTVASIVVASALWLAHWNSERKTVEVNILPLRSGHAVFSDAFGQADDLLINCGNDSSVDAVTKPFLRAQGINRVQNFFLTHGESREIGGAENIFTNFSTAKIFTSPARARSTIYRQIINHLEKTPDRHQIIEAGNRFGCWTILHPATRDQFPLADDNALVLLGKIHDTTILLLSELGRAGQNALLERHPDLHADIVVAGLPTEGEPLNDSLLATLQPKLVVIADAEFPATRRASQKLHARLSQKNIRVIFCREAGALTLKFQPGGWEMQNASAIALARSNTP